MTSTTTPPRGPLSWLGLTGEHEPQPGEIRPLWDQVPKKKYLAISIPLTIGAIALFFLLRHEGIEWQFASMFAVQSFALALLIFERASIKVPPPTDKEVK